MRKKLLRIYNGPRMSGSKISEAWESQDIPTPPFRRLSSSTDGSANSLPRLYNSDNNISHQNGLRIK